MTDTNTIPKVKSQDNCVTLSNGIPSKLPCQDNCQAPLCPLDCHDKAVWYPDDDICYSKAISKPSWVSAQRKIQRLYRQGLIDDGECFTRPMLEGIKRIVKGLHGMKPENLHKAGPGQAAQNRSILRKKAFLSLTVATPARNMTDCTVGKTKVLF